MNITVSSGEPSSISLNLYIYSGVLHSVTSCPLSDECNPQSQLIQLKWNPRCSRRWLPRKPSFEMWRRVVWKKFTEISDQSIARVFRAETYEVRQFNSRKSRSVSLGCWVRQNRVLKHVWTCSNLLLHEPRTKRVFRSPAEEEVVLVRGIRLAEKWVTRIWSSG